ncbi:MAG TPA: protein-export chaperone SecB [bacterium]|jgi:preprotein translocase subunit SecB|nr:protein-export chaperone SecB [bacterium]
MENNSALAPGVQLHGIFLTSLDFKYQEVLETEKKLHVRMHMENNINEELHTLQSDLVFDVQSAESAESSQFHIAVTFRALFQEIPGGPIDLKRFSEVNSPAIVFPFVRETIASITAKSPIGLLLLPPMNIGSLIRGETQRTERITQ